MKLCYKLNNPDTRRGRLIAPSADVSALAGFPAILIILLISIICLAHPSLVAYGQEFVSPAFCSVMSGFLGLCRFLQQFLSTPFSQHVEYPPKQEDVDAQFECSYKIPTEYIGDPMVFCHKT